MQIVFVVVAAAVLVVMAVAGLANNLVTRPSRHLRQYQNNEYPDEATLVRPKQRVEKLLNFAEMRKCEIRLRDDPMRNPYG